MTTKNKGKTILIHFVEQSFSGQSWVDVSNQTEDSDFFLNILEGKTELDIKKYMF